MINYDLINEVLNDPKKTIFVALFFLMISELIAGIVLILFTKTFLNNSTLVNAKITKLEHIDDSTKAHISFMDHQGMYVETILFIRFNKYHINDFVEVWYNKNNTSKVKQNSFLSLWLLPMALLQGFVTTGIIVAILLALDIAAFPF